MLAAGVAIGYGTPMTLTDTSNKIKKGTKGDVTVLKPTLLTAVPAIIDRIQDGVIKKVEEKGGLAKNLFQTAYNHRLAAVKGSWLEAWSGLKYQEEKASSACVSRILKQPPGKFICHVVEELGIIEGPLLIEALHVYVKERRLLLRGSFNRDNVDSANNSPASQKKTLYNFNERRVFCGINQLVVFKQNIL
ncbi:hypothetical protein KIW84_023844 [Lathyrus oleraceus]|uniref:Uncharacterized protein n=1 Tax=Pisum sativum TaxID=3888 RepID=A0A9D4YF89_PEA|nr:hypothetical protein KIW84_023844 [Pisum sativum]